MVTDGEILKVLHGDRIILKEKKRTRGYYYLVESPVRDEASGARRSLKRDGAPDGGGSGTKGKTRKDKRRRRRVKFLLSWETSPSKSLVRMDTTHDGDRIEQSDSTLTFAHP